MPSDDRAGSLSSPIRAVVSFRHVVGAPPEVVFPLLCPIRECEWIPGWGGEVVCSASGVAERDGVFRAGLSGARATYVVTRYEPPCAIEYLVLSDPALVDALALTLEAAPAPAPGGVTALTWRRTFTALAAEGEARVAERAAAFEARVPHLAELLERYLPNAAGEAKRTFAT